MAYTPHASAAAQPLDTVDRSTAAAEFRELKTHINGITTVASAASPDIFNNTNKTINYSGAITATSFVAAPQAGASRLLYCTGAAKFTASVNMIIDGTPAGDFTAAAGYLIQVLALTTTQFKLSLISPVLVTHASTADTATSLTATSSIATTGTIVRASAAGIGVTATSNNSLGIWGTGTTGGVRGDCASNPAVAGYSATSSGVYAQSNSGEGVVGYSNSNVGVHAQSSAGPALKLAPRLSAPSTSISDGCVYTDATGQPFVRVSGVWRQFSLL